MLTAVCGWILLQKGTALLEGGGEGAVDGNIAQRRLPGAFTDDCQGVADAGVVGAHHEAELGNLQCSEHGARYMAGIDIAGMGYDAAQRGERRLSRSLGQVGVNLHAQSLRIAGIETPGYRGMANGGRGHRRSSPRGSSAQHCADYRYATSHRGSFA